jgi:anti-sigma-K factor RskA
MISDDDLLLYYYRDGLDATQRARIGTALAEQPELARRLHRLVAQLDTVADMPEVPVPPHIRQRWENAVGRLAPANRKPRPFAAFRWQAAAAAIVAVVLLVTVQLLLRSPQEQPLADATPVQSAYERGLRWHLASTEQGLAELDGAQPEERARLIATIVGQNRMYALAAERANEPQLARVLRAFTPILESLAAEPGDASASDVAQLSFELRVMLARLKAETATSPPAERISL